MFSVCGIFLKVQSVKSCHMCVAPEFTIKNKASKRIFLPEVKRTFTCIPTNAPVQFRYQVPWANWKDQSLTALFLQIGKQWSRVRIEPACGFRIIHLQSPRGSLPGPQEKQRFPPPFLPSLMISMRVEICSISCNRCEETITVLLRLLAQVQNHGSAYLRYPSGSSPLVGSSKIDQTRIMNKGHGNA